MAAKSPTPHWVIEVGSHSLVGKVRDHNHNAWSIDLDNGLYAAADDLDGRDNVTSVAVVDLTG